MGYLFIMTKTSKKYFSPMEIWQEQACTEKNKKKLLKVQFGFLPAAAAEVNFKFLLQNASLSIMLTNFQFSLIRMDLRFLL